MSPRAAFTLVELVVVILILGILAGIAAPKLLNTSELANENAMRQSLSVVRDAIDLYATMNAGQLPGADGNQATFKRNLHPFLCTFPENPLGAHPDGLAEVQIETTGAPMAKSLSDKHGWIYDNVTGEFRANLSTYACDGTTRLVDF